MPAPALNRTDPESTPVGLVLMLHGGAKHGTDEVRARSASLRRTAAMRDALAPRLVRAGLSVWLLRYGVRGWNAGAGHEPAPVTDARWALDEARAAHPGVPVVLLGHSMGGRTAIHVADHPSVTGVVALAPWLERSDPVHTLAGRHLLAGHGSRDRITSPRATRAYVARAERTAASAEFVELADRGHYMLRGVVEWNRFALRSTIDVLTRGGVDLQDQAAG